MSNLALLFLTCITFTVPAELVLPLIKKFKGLNHTNDTTKTKRTNETTQTKILNHSQVQTNLVQKPKKYNKKQQQTHCKIRKGNHTHLYSCPQLPTVIDSKKLQLGVWYLCSNTSSMLTPSECHYHLKNLPFQCNISGIHKLMCKCSNHTEQQKWCKQKFEHNLEFKNQKMYKNTNKF